MSRQASFVRQSSALAAQFEEIKQSIEIEAMNEKI